MRTRNQLRHNELLLFKSSWFSARFCARGHRAEDIEKCSTRTCTFLMGCSRMSHLADGPSGLAPFYVAPDSENESLKSLALSESFMWIALWILGQLRKHSVGGHIIASAIEVKWSRASLLCRRLYRSHHSEETLRATLLTVWRRTYLQ